MTIPLADFVAGDATIIVVIGDGGGSTSVGVGTAVIQGRQLRLKATALVAEIPVAHGAGLAGTGHQGVEGVDVAEVLSEAYGRKMR